MDKRLEDPGVSLDKRLVDADRSLDKRLVDVGRSIFAMRFFEPERSNRFELDWLSFPIR